MPTEPWPVVATERIAAKAKNALVGGPFGSDLISKDYAPTGVPVIRGQNMRGRWIGGTFVYVSPAKAEALSSNLARPRDIVFTQRGTLGQVALVPDAPWPHYLVSQSQMKLTVDPQVADARFYYYVYTSPEQQDYTKQRAIQTGVPHTNLSILRQTPVPLPPLPEQRAIAAVLGALDDKIEVNRMQARVLEEIARAVFTSWFVNFDPVRRAAAGKATDLPPDLAALFPKRLVDSPIGEVPEGWRVGTLGEVCEKPQYGLTASAADEAVGPKFLRITDINKEPWINWSTVPFCEIPAGEDAAKYRLRRGDLVIARMADPGHAALIEEDPEAVFASYLIRFRPRAAEAARYLQYWTRSAAYWDLVHGRKTGSTRATLNATELGELPLLIPPTPALARFTAFADSLRARGVHAMAQATTLAALRDALLPKLISGELRIADAEKIVGRAV